MSAYRRCLFLAACIIGLALQPSGLAAQVPAGTDPRALLSQYSTAEILQRLRASGMTRQQARAELQRRGYDPSLVDPYFDMLDGDQPGGRRDSFVGALASAGLARESVDPPRVRSDEPMLSGDILDLESLLGLTAVDRLDPRELRVFGMSFFRRMPLSMDEPGFGPVSPGYRLGPGDDVNVILTGAVQEVYPLRVSREGTLVVPDVGQIPVAGLTVNALEDLLRARFADVHASGLARVSVGLGQLRSIEVFIVGDVQRPGPYRVSALATVVSALHRAGGPTETGSFREIEVRRGNAIVRRIDLYEYLLHGNSADDVRLQHGDVLFVPPVGRRIRIEGAVKRPAIYELLEGDGLRGAIRFAGGPDAEAALRQVQIDRVVPPLERTPGVERVLLDVDILRLLAPGEPDMPLRDGDRINVVTIGEERRNVVAVDGEVRRPGRYGWAPGITVADVLERAAGATDAAYLDRAHIFRFDPATGARRLLSITLHGDAVPILLEDRDSLVVYSRDDLRTQEYVSIGGEVKRPGQYPLAEGATVTDLILAAGGFAEGAHRHEAYVARRALVGRGSDTTATTFRVPLGATDGSSRLPPEWRPGTGEFAVQHGDIIEIRPLQGYTGAGSVVVLGEVQLPGLYVLESRTERVASLLTAAGGFTSEARADGLHVIRAGRALAPPDNGAVRTILLQDGDTIRVPRFDPTILVTGAVVHDSTRVVYRPGMTVRDAVREAGGFARDADTSRLTVTHQNGHRATVQHVPLWRDRQPGAEPGSVVHVPARPPGARDGPNWPMVVSQIVGVVSAAATLIIALNQ
jgi:polysaccharide biosynthesis/export protein